MVKHNMNMDIHKTTELIAYNIQQLGDGEIFHTRTIVVRSEFNTPSRLTLFAENPSDLEFKLVGDTE